MNKFVNIFVILCVLCVYGMANISIGYATATDGTVTYDNTTNTSQIAIATPTSTQTPMPTLTPTQTATVPVSTTEKEKKFRIGPTVKLRPLNDEINKSSDGLVELYMDNPSLNDVDLTVDARISVPAGIHIYGQGFGEAGAAGTVYGVFEVPPGKARTIYITIKAEKVGDFYAQFSGTYYPGDNKDDYQPISLTHPFKVYEASDINNPVNTVQMPPVKNPSIPVSIAILIVIISAMLLKRRRK